MHRRRRMNMSLVFLFCLIACSLVETGKRTDDDGRILTVQETSVDSGSCDELLTFLSTLQSDLKNVDEVYQGVMKADLYKEELLEFAEDDIRKMLDGKLAHRYIARLIKALRKIPESRLYKQDQQKPVVVLSTEEDTALNDVSKKRQEFKANMERITETINELQVSGKSNEASINGVFDEIIKVANQRRDELLQKLALLKQEKEEKLSQQMSTIKEFNDKLVSVYDKAQTLIQDTSIDALKRKTQILASTEHILKSAEKLSPFSLAATSRIHSVLDTKSIIREFAHFGDVLNGDLAAAPVVVVESVTARSATLKIRSEDVEAEVLGYRVQYAQKNGAEFDEKLEWADAEISDQSKQIEYTLKGLEPATKYAVRCAAEYQFGHGLLSELLGFETTKWQFDVVTDRYQDWIEQNGKVFHAKGGTDCVTASSRKGYSDGVHVLQVQLKGKHLRNAAFSITDSVVVGNEWISAHKGTHYYFHYGGGVYTGKDRNLGTVQQWKVNDVLTLTLNCNEWTVTFAIAGSSNTFAIEKNKIYYPCVTTQGTKGTEFHIVN